MTEAQVVEAVRSVKRLIEEDGLLPLTWLDSTPRPRPQPALLRTALSCSLLACPAAQAPGPVLWHTASLALTICQQLELLAGGAGLEPGQVSALLTEYPDLASAEHTGPATYTRPGDTDLPEEFRFLVQEEIGAAVSDFTVHCALNTLLGRMRAGVAVW